MFKDFLSAFKDDGKTTEMFVAPLSFRDALLCEVIVRFGGRSFNRGMYRVGSERNISSWNDWVLSAFPSFSDRIDCFGVDWLGRIFAVDYQRKENGYPGVLMFEPGTAEALEIPCNVETFHNNELVQYREEALAESFYFRWISAGGRPPKLDQCIGYKKPLFLGGADAVENLELSDLDVYWTIAAQIIERTRRLPLR